MNQNPTCQHFQPQIFQLHEAPAEGGMSTGQCRQLQQHLRECASCRKIADEERKLTALLTDQDPDRVHPEQRATPATRREHSGQSRNETGWKWMAATSLALVAAIAIWQINRSLASGNGNNRIAGNPSADSTSAGMGTITERPVITHASFVAQPEVLQAANHIDLPFGAAATIELIDTGMINAIGPAMFEIDQVGDSWKITLLKGQLKVSLENNARVQVAGQQGLVWLEQGTHLVSSNSDSLVQTRLQQEEGNDEDPASLLEKGLKVFQADSNATAEDMAEAAERLVKVFEHPDATPQQKLGGGFYGVAALANSDQHQKVLDVGTKWQEMFGDEMGETVPVLIVKAKFMLGQTDEARQAAKQLIEKYPDSPYRPMMESIAGGTGDNAAATPSRTIPPQSRPPYTSASQSGVFIAGQTNGYLVVKVGLTEDNPDHQKFREVAKRAATFHHADTIDFGGKDFQQLRQQIERFKPANVLFVIPPQLLDVNFHRKVFQISPTLDNDLFVDFAWGYLTARDGTAIEKFWQRIENLHRHGLANKNWLETSVPGGDSKSYTSENAILAAAIAAGFTGNQLYFACFESDPDVSRFIDSKKTEFENASVIAMTGNGDPQGIWLFDGNRNMDSSLHWEYDKSKVGQDPNNEMLRLKADWFRQLRLQSPIIWSGTCHSGACYRVYVEGDIVSTFGKSETAVVYDLPADESLGLAFIDAGAGSLLVPIAANHGLAVSMENDFMLKHGATLGQTIKSTWDDAILQAGGIPHLLIVKEGDPPDYYSEPVMQSGGINRILIGDPALSLFEAASVPGEILTVDFDKGDHTLHVELNWEKGYHPAGWNLFADGRGFGQRMKTRIDCTDMREVIAASRNGSLSVSATIVDGTGNKLDCHTLGDVETISGRSYLYLQASSAERSLPHAHHIARFVVQW